MTKKFTLLHLLFVFTFLPFVYAQNIPIIKKAVGFDVSIPLRDMVNVPNNGLYKTWKNGVVVNKFNIKKVINPNKTAYYPELQSLQGQRAPMVPVQNFEGSNNNDNGASRVTPPDTDGDVGLNHYVQSVNGMFRVLSKTGSTLYGPVTNSTIWSGFSGPWDGHNDGDPIVLYDENADRWITSQFAIDCGASGQMYELIAVSQTGDPTGSWYRYAFEFDYMPDYPHLGIWGDGYYMAINRFNYTSGAFIGAGAVVFERTQMLAGNASARMVFFNTETISGGGADCASMLPADCDGTSAPTGTSCPFIYFNDNAWGGNDELRVWMFHTDWTNTANSTFTYQGAIAVQAFDSQFTTDIPQPGAIKLNTLSDRLMYRLQYRNFGSYQALVTNHSVEVATSQSGVRWYELRNTGGNWGMYQQGTYAPDSYSRWMGSIALNTNGDIGLGYTVSGSTLNPAIRYTGRLATDPLGQMTFAEQVIQQSTTSMTDYSRWGDYSMMSVDPSDGLTFWHTNEYVGSYGGWCPWSTKIASFKFASTPTVATLAATSVTASSATLNGNVNPNGFSTNYHFEYGTTVSYGSSTATLSAGSGSTATAVNNNISGLIAGMPYHFRLVAVNSEGTANGDDMTFIPGLGVVTTAAVSSITTISAVCGGTVVSDGGSAITARGVCWSTTINPVATGSHTVDGSGLGVFASNITGLAPNTTYHVRAYATNSGGTVYGADIQFSTLCAQYSLPFSEPFTNATMPSCWSQTDLVGNGQIWQFGTITGQSPNPILSGNYAYLNSDAYGSGNSQSVDLVTPSIDCYNLTNITLQFNHYFKAYSGSSGTLYYSINGGFTWTQITQFTTTTALNPTAFSQIIAAASGQGQVKFKWNYTGSYAWYWAIDNIQVTGTPLNTLGVTPSSQSVTSSAGSTNFSVSSNTTWTAVSNSAWCTVPISGSGSGTLTATYAANTTASPRTASITITASGPTPIVITVVQAASSSALTVLPSSQAVWSYPGTTVFAVNSSLAWTASSDAAWCSVTPSGAGTGNLTAIFVQNPGNTSRTANITVAIAGTNVIVQVIQAAKSLITTTSVTGITSISAVSGGNVVSDGGASVTGRGVCWSSLSNPTIADNFTVDGSGTGVFTSSILNLLPNQTYHLRAYATNGQEVFYGSDFQFTTPGTPVLTTAAVTGILGTGATSGGNVTAQGASAVTARGVCWNLGGSPTILDYLTNDGSGTGTFTSAISGLTSGLTYFVRAYATNAEGTAYGNEVYFTAVSIPTFTELVVPKYIAGKTATAVNNARSAFAVCVKFDGLTPLTTYRIRAGLELTTGSVSSYGAGNYWDGAAFIGSGSIDTTGFVTDASGSSGPFWLVYQPTGNSTRFLPGQQHLIRISAFTTATSPGTPQFSGSKIITCLDVATTAMTAATNDDGAYIKGSADPSVTGKYVLLFDNESGTGDPLFSYQVRQANATQAANSQLNTQINDIYMQAGTSAVGDYPAVVPIGANNPAGVRRVEARTSANVLSGFNTDSDGIWPSSITLGNTTNMSRLELRNITVTDAPLTNLPPLIVTTAVSNIGITTASSGGQATVTGALPITARGVCWDTISEPNLADGFTSDGTGGGAFTSNLSGLLPSKTYFVRAYATNSFGTAYGNEYTFTTINFPTLSTTAASLIGASTASAGGIITSNGGSTVLARGVCWSTISEPTIADDHTTDGPGSGTFVSSITGLLPTTTYFIRAYATNAGGTAYGNELSFTTICASATLPLNEIFSASTIPACWTVQNIGTGVLDEWTISTTTNAGGSANELKSSYQVITSGTTRMILQPLNTTSFSVLNVSFKHMVDGYSTGTTLKIQSSPDGITWTDEAWSLALTSENIPSTTVNTTILNNLHSPATFIAFTVEGNLLNYDYWYIDNLQITGSENFLSVTPPTQNMAAEAGSTVNFTVNSSTNWSTSCDAAWCTVTPSGIGNGTLAATGSANSSSLARTATITVSASGTPPINVIIVQAGNGSTLSVTPLTQNVWSFSGSANYLVTTISPWTATSDAYWCTVTPTGNGNGTLVANFLQNLTNLSRTANITFSVLGLEPVVVTLVQSPTVALTTTAISGITLTTAQSGGEITFDGGSAITTRGVCWGTSLNPLATGYHTVDGSGSGVFTSSLSGLSNSTIYHVRAYATNAHGTFYGPDVQFTTKCPALALPFSESFADITFPMCWSEQHEGTGATNNWSVSVSANAGSVANEMKSSWQTVSPGVTRLVTPAFNTIGVSQLNLSFKHMLNAFGVGATLKIQSSADGVVWTDEAWTVATTATNIAASTVATTVLSNLNSATTYIAFTVSGNLYQYDFWYIDDVSVSAVCTEPLIQVSNFQTPAVTTTTMDLTWTRGSGNGVIVVASADAPVSSYPVNGVAYGGNTIFGTGQEIGTGNFVVYSGTGSSCSLTNLQPGTMYYYNLFEYNTPLYCYKQPPEASESNTFCAAVGSFPYTEDFENFGNIPLCWSQQYVTGTLQWGCATGGYGGSPATAHSGTYNARFYEGATGTVNVSKLISPAFNLSNRVNNTLTFWHTQALWSPDQDEMRVYYRTSATGALNILATYTANIAAWTMETIALPNPSAEYYIAFEGTEKYGHGVCVDDITIDGTPVTLTVTPPVQSVTSTAGNTTFVVATQVAWTASSNAAWCTVTPSGTGSGALTAAYTENTTISPRSANITITVSGLSPVVVTVTQAEGMPSLSVSPPNRNVTVNAGNTTFAVTSNSTWNVNSNAAWCTASPSGMGNGTITAIYEENTSFVTRIATLTISVSGLTPINVTVTQAAAVPTLSVLPALQNVPANAGTVDFAITSNAAWTADSDALWCTVTHAGTGNGTLTATYSENTSLMPRTATITVSVSGLAPVMVSVVQAGATPTLLVSPPVQNVGSQAGTSVFDVTSNMDWSAESDALWCSVTPSGSGNGAITASYTENTSILPRTATITVSVSGLAPVMVSVVQEGATPTLLVSPPVQNVGNQAGTSVFDVTSNTDWSAESDALWCSVTPSGNGNGAITASYSENTSILPRTATITVSVSGLAPVMVSVVQEGATPTLLVSPPVQNVGNQAGTSVFDVTSNTDWSAESDALWCTVTPSGSGNGAVTAIYTENPAYLSRTAHITVTVSGIATVEVVLEQSGADTLLTITLLPEGLFNGSGLNKAQNGTGDQFTGNIADQVTIEVHSSVTPYELVVPAIPADLSTLGVAIAVLPASLNGLYYIAIKHRNSIETWSETPVLFGSGSVTYDFTDAQTKAYGANLKLNSGKYVAPTGDVNQDGLIDALDLIAIDNLAAGFGTGYVPEDLNGDGAINAVDILIAITNAAEFVRGLRP